MQYDSEHNLTFHIYFSGLLEIVLVVQQRTVRVHCVEGNVFQLPREEAKGKSCAFEGARGAVATCAFIDYVYELVTVARLSESIAGGSRLLHSGRMCLFVCVVAVEGREN